LWGLFVEVPPIVIILGAKRTRDNQCIANRQDLERAIVVDVDSDNFEAKAAAA